MIINLAKIRFGGGGGAPAKPEDSFQETYTANGAYDITPEEGHVFSGGHVEVDVHPTDKLTRTYTENNTYEISGEWTNAEITVAVPGPVEETFDITPTNSDITVVPTVADNVFSGGVVRGYDVDPIYNALEDLNTGDPTAPSAINFSIIGWSSEDSNAWNNDINAKVAYSKTKYDEWDPSSTNTSYFYSGDDHLVFAPGIDTSNVTDMQYMFNNCSKLTSVPQMNTSKVTNMDNMFSGCSSLTSVSQLDTSNVTIMGSMFRGCTSLTSVPQLDTSNVTNMDSMFSGCSSLTSIPQLDTSNVTNMNNMFSSCHNLTTIPQLDMSNVTSAGGMFGSCIKLESIPALDTSKCTDINYLFEECYNLGNIWGIDFSSVSRDTIGLAWNMGYPINLRLTGCLNHNFDIANCSSNLNYESIKSILEACNRTTNTDPKTVYFNTTITDQNGELAGLVSSCATKGWTVTGLTIN